MAAKEKLMLFIVRGAVNAFPEAQRVKIYALADHIGRVVDAAGPDVGPMALCIAGLTAAADSEQTEKLVNDLTKGMQKDHDTSKNN